MIRSDDLLVVGVGGGGRRLAARLAERHEGEDGLLIYAADTDRRDLEHTPAGLERLLFGLATTAGLGAGGDEAKGRAAAERDTDLLQRVLMGHRFVLLLAGLGGGVGSGATPVLARLAQDAGCHVAILATVPFGFEGDARRSTARRTWDHLHKLSGVCLCLDADQWAEDDLGERPLPEAFARLDQPLLAFGQLLIRICRDGNHLNLDFNAVRAFCRQVRGRCRVACQEAEGEDRAVRLVQELTRSRAGREALAIPEPSRALLIAEAGPDLTLGEVDRVSRGLRDAAADHHGQWATAVLLDESATDRPVRLFLLAGRAEAPAADAVPPASAPAPAARRGRKGGPEQISLPLDPPRPARFQKTEPTIYHGVDLDIPTFIRRKVKLTTQK